MATRLTSKKKSCVELVCFILIGRLGRCVSGTIGNVESRLTGNSITMDKAREFEHSLQPTNASSIVPPIPPTSSFSPDNADETRTLTFAELKELIETGKVDQIPNNKVIPEALNVSAATFPNRNDVQSIFFQDASPSDSTVPVRKKPWELVAAAESS